MHVCQQRTVTFPAWQTFTMDYLGRFVYRSLHSCDEVRAAGNQSRHLKSLKNSHGLAPSVCDKPLHKSISVVLFVASRHRHFYPSAPLLRENNGVWAKTRRNRRGGHGRQRTTFTDGVLRDIVAAIVCHIGIFSRRCDGDECRNQTRLNRRRGHGQ